MNQRFRMFIALLCLMCAACSDSAETPSDVVQGDRLQGDRPPTVRQISTNAPAPGEAVDAAELLKDQAELREEFDGWQRDSADESKPLEERNEALTALVDHAKRVSGVEQKPWGTVRHELIDQESARVLRRLATSDQAEIRARSINTLGQLKDIDGMDVILAGLEDESLEVRTAAHSALRNIMSTDFAFRADDAPQERARAVARAKDFWTTCLANARFIEGVRNPALLKKWKAAATWDYDAEPRLKESGDERSRN